MLTSEEVYNAFCRDRCKYLNPPTVDALDACTDCPVSRLSAPPPWYAYPDYIPPPDTPCLLVSIEKSKMHYTTGVYKVFSETKKGFFNPIFLDKHAQIYPAAWQPIKEPVYFMQKPKKR